MIFALTLLGLFSYHLHLILKALYVLPGLPLEVGLPMAFHEKLLVLRFQLVKTTLDSLNVQLELLLNPDVLSYICLKTLDELLVDLGRPIT